MTDREKEKGGTMKGRGRERERRKRGEKTETETETERKRGRECFCCWDADARYVCKRGRVWFARESRERRQLTIYISTNNRTKPAIMAKHHYLRVRFTIPSARVMKHSALQTFPTCGILLPVAPVRLKSDS